MTDFLTVEQAATHAGISTRTMFTRMKEPNGPRKTKVGKRFLIARPDFDAWMTRCRQP
jgi:excisionase family DNA binding protein